MLTRLLVYLCGASPAARRWLWRWWYAKLARRVAAENWTFMNYGLAEADPASRPPLDTADEPDRFCIQLYERVVSPVKLARLEVLEVGSGRGGGASYLARRHRPRALVGVDFAPPAVALAERLHKNVANLSFRVGDAENLPFPDACFDAVVNVESSHCYGNVERFFREVVRALRPGGHFVMADLRDPAAMEKLREGLLAAGGWALVEHEDITPRVLQALREDDARKRRLIEELVPHKLRPLFREFAGLEGGSVSQALRDGSLLYHRFALKKRD